MGLVARRGQGRAAQFPTTETEDSRLGGATGRHMDERQEIWKECGPRKDNDMAAADDERGGC